MWMTAVESPPVQGGKDVKDNKKSAYSPLTRLIRGNIFSLQVFD